MTGHRTFGGFRNHIDSLDDNFLKREPVKSKGNQQNPRANGFQVPERLYGFLETLWEFK